MPARRTHFQHDEIWPDEDTGMTEARQVEPNGCWTDEAQRPMLPTNGIKANPKDRFER